MSKLFDFEIIKKLSFLSVLVLMTVGISFPGYQASAEISLPPKGVSQELWKAYQEVVVSDIGGADRNLRWNTNPTFYVSGNPTAADNNTFQGTLAEIRKYCTNIQPTIATSEPFEGVILKYLPRGDFKNLIPGTPDTVSSSYASYLYFLNRGLTKFTAAISTNASQAQRDSDTQIRLLQGFGLLGYTKNTNARMFSWTFSDSGVTPASELDKQIIRLYCSSYSRSWDTSQQTFDLIASAWSKKINIPNMGLNIKVGEYKNQLNFTFNFDASRALDNQLTGIQYTIFDSAGNITTSGKLDVSNNLFQSYQVVLSGIKDNSRYKIEAYPVNENGNGPLSKGEGRAGMISAPSDSDSPGGTGATAEVLDARSAAGDAIDAANEALIEFGRYKTSCSEVSLGFQEMEQELFDSTNLVNYCNQLDEQISLLDAKIGALDPDKALTSAQASKIVDEANLLAENADVFVAQIQDITDELLATEKLFTRIILALEPINQIETDVAEPWELLQERLTILPLTSINSIKKSKTYKTALNLSAQAVSLVKQRDIQLERLSTLENPKQLSAVATTIIGIKISVSQVPDFRKSINLINKSIPANVCQKGAALVLASKSGKCAKGFEVIPTS